MKDETKEGRQMRHGRMRIVVLCLFIVSPFALLGIGQLPFVYDRHFNRIQARLEVLPDTRIVDSWRHEDITLEDFGFDLKVRQCPPIRLNFYEGEDWYREFAEIDGILFSKPYNPATNDYETTRVTCDELARAGIRVRNLDDIVSELEAILAYLRARPQKPPDTLRSGSYFIRIFYDLDAYKKALNAA